MICVFYGTLVTHGGFELIKFPEFNMWMWRITVFFLDSKQIFTIFGVLKLEYVEFENKMTKKYKKKNLFNDYEKTYRTYVGVWTRFFEDDTSHLTTKAEIILE